MAHSPIDFPRYIDHTLLAMDATQQQIEQLCQEARQYHFYTICINSGYVPLAKKLLVGSEVKICSVVGFPLGAGLSSAKAFEAKAAIEAGADEIDMVINVGWLKSKDINAVTQDIKAVHSACQAIPLKVILETCLLTAEEITLLCKICRELKVAFVKTSTGFSKSGATIEAVALMSKLAGGEMEVKASGGIRDVDTATRMIEAGATRIGTSSGVAIVTPADTL